MAIKFTKVPLLGTSFMLYTQIPVVPGAELPISSSSISVLCSERDCTPRRIYRTGLSRSNTLDLYSGGAWFESRHGHRLYFLRVFMVSLSPPGICGVSTSSRPGPLLSKPFSFHHLSNTFHPTLYSLRVESVVK
jgi:hypothetical protein